MTDRPVILTTLGDASGIGSELSARSLTHPDATEGVQRVIIGDPTIYRRGLEIADVDVEIPTVASFEEAVDNDEPIVFWAFDQPAIRDLPYGEATEEAGAADLAIGRQVAELAKDKAIAGFIFAPVNKASLKMAGSAFEGYKAYIQDRMGIKGTSAEINTLGHLWTTRVTSHIALADVPKNVTKDTVLKTIRYFQRELRRFGYDNPKIAVSGLNPHNGDGGLFGREELDHIQPAVEAAQKYQINCAGPYPADTIFLTVKEEAFLGVVSMYHDQCQIATKLMGFDEGVTYFGGLPIPIMTPAHGTAYDIAGQGKAIETPMVNALKLMTKAARKAKGLPVT
jgi:4-hydroxythreonine-4-phosphate dehydrogenase